MKEFVPTSFVQLHSHMLFNTFVSKLLKKISSLWLIILHILFSFCKVNSIFKWKIQSNWLKNYKGQYRTESNHVESDGCTMPWKSFNMQDYYASSGYKKNAICVFFPSHERKMALLHIFYLQPIKTVSILLNWWKNGGAGKGDNAFVVLDMKAKTSPALWTEPTVAQGTESECGYRTLLMGKNVSTITCPFVKRTWGVEFCGGELWELQRASAGGCWSCLHLQVSDRFPSSLIRDCVLDSAQCH